MKYKIHRKPEDSLSEKELIKTSPAHYELWRRTRDQNLHVYPVMVGIKDSKDAGGKV